MCYSAQIEHDFQRYVREYGAHIDLKAFVRLYWERRGDKTIKIPKALDLAFARPHTDDEWQINVWIKEHDRGQAVQLEQELFKQRKRRVDAERILAVRNTWTAQESRRIAIDRMIRARGQLEDLWRTVPADRDARVFPGYYAPVMVVEHGRRIVRPMRYQCRPEGAPAAFDRKHPSSCNARRDRLEGFWKGAFGRHHALWLIRAFYENVSRHRMEGRELAPDETEQSVVLEFRPEPAQDMLVACLWSAWEGEGEALRSFAAITDVSPPEVAAAGHDRSVIPIRCDNIDSWLCPDSADLAAQYALLDDRERLHFEHRLAA